MRAVGRIWRLLMSRLADYRDGLDATAALGAGPAGSVEQQAAELPLQAGSHLTPLAAPHDSGWWGREDERVRVRTMTRHVSDQRDVLSYEQLLRKWLQGCEDI